MNKKIWVSVVVSIIVISSIGVVFWWQMSQKSEKKPINQNIEYPVEFVRPGYISGGNYYNGSNISFDVSLSAKLETWSSYGNVYDVVFHTNREKATQIASALGVNGTISNGYEGWRIENGQKSVEFITPDYNPNSNYSMSLRYRDSSIPVGVDESKFISNESCVEIVQRFMETTVLSKILVNAKNNLRIECRYVGADKEYIPGGTVKIIAKVVDAKMYYDSFELDWRYAFRLNSTGHILWIDGPTDFTLSKNSSVYIGSPNQILQYIKKEGLLINKTSDKVEKILITDIRTLYAAMPEISGPAVTGVVLAPMHYITYEVYYSDNSTEISYDALTIKGA
ncbi:MAG: hypothetical protein QXU48_02365 [Thermoplasmata archaeon]